MTPSPLLSIILSMRNEETVLPELIRRLEAVLTAQSILYEIIFIEDASTDQSAKILDENAKRNPAIKILHFSRRFGVQASIWAGLQHASGEAVIMMDADLQDPPELIPDMLQKWREGADIVHMVRSSRDGEGKIKMFLTRCAYVAISKLSPHPFPFEAGDFKLLSAKAVKELLKYQDQQPYIRGLTASLGFSQALIEYRREKRFAGNSHFTLLGRGPVETFLTGVVSFSPLPLYLIAFLGLMLTAVSILGFLISIFFTSGGFLWIYSLIGFLLSLNLSAAGILGLYIWFIFKQVQKHPLYIVERKINF